MDSKPLVLQGTTVVDRKGGELWVFQIPVKMADSPEKEAMLCVSMVTLMEFPFLLACEEHPGIWRVFGDDAEMEVAPVRLAETLRTATWQDVVLQPPPEEKLE